jgi:hypothetical protein
MCLQIFSALLSELLVVSNYPFANQFICSQVVFSTNILSIVQYSSRMITSCKHLELCTENSSVAAQVECITASGGEVVKIVA